jgi:hypothetical protein
MREERMASNSSLPATALPVSGSRGRLRISSEPSQPLAPPLSLTYELREFGWRSQLESQTQYSKPESTILDRMSDLTFPIGFDYFVHSVLKPLSLSNLLFFIRISVGSDSDDAEGRRSFQLPRWFRKIEQRDRTGIRSLRPIIRR